jgi:hypothetical protein
LEEFQLSSKELEEELEKEIDSTERRYNEIKIRNEAMRQEVDDWKVTQPNHADIWRCVDVQVWISLLTELPFDLTNIGKVPPSDQGVECQHQSTHPPTGYSETTDRDVYEQRKGTRAGQ